MFATLLELELKAPVSCYAEAHARVSQFTASRPDNEILVHLRRWQFQDLLVRSAPGAVTAGTGCAMNFAAVYDEIQVLAVHARAQGAGSVEEPVDTPWNTRDLTTSEFDGNVVVFTAARPPGPQDATFSQQMQRRSTQLTVVDRADAGSGILLRDASEIDSRLAHRDAWCQDRAPWLG